jgi:predicted phage-related endonuclease
MKIASRTTHDVQQGTGPWLRLREGFDTASEAPAALGVSRYVTRAELLRRKHTGIAEEHSAATLGKFAAGHEAEARARPLAEAEVGGELFPVTMSAVVEGLPLLSSLDGQTLEGDVIWETKLWNEELAAAVRKGAAALPDHYTVQMDQELLVSGAERCLFTCTDGTQERYVSCWYEARPGRFAALIEGWRQFRADLAAYVLPEAAAPAPTGKAPETLPALLIEVTGKVTASNLAEFKATALAAIRSVNRELKTDQDFADASKAVKWCSDVETRLEAAKQHALSQTASIDALFKAMDDIGTEARRVRLDLDKLVTRRKTEVKEEAVVAARSALAAHYVSLNAELAPTALSVPLVDFAGAIKGLRSFDSMQDALDTLLAQSKIDADATARTVRTNQATFKRTAAGFEFLYPDLAQLLLKRPDDFAAVLAARHAAHQRAELERQEAERAKIRAEEERRQAAERQRQERLAAERKERIDTRIDLLRGLLTDCVNDSAQQIEARRLAVMGTEPSEDLYGDRMGEAVTLRSQVLIALGEQHADALRREAEAAEAAEAKAAASAPAPAQAPAAQQLGDLFAVRQYAPEPAPAVQPPTVPRAPAEEQPTLKLGQINERLGYIVNADLLGRLGFAAHCDRTARLYREGDFKAICAALSAHTLAVAAELKVAA